MCAIKRPTQGLLILLAMTLTPGSYCFLLPENQLLIGVVGGVDRAAYLEYWNTTIARLFKVHFFNEQGLPPCVVCNRSHSGNHTKYEVFHTPWFHKSHGWWCAQSRPVQILRLLHEKASSNFSILPSFFLLADDDTWLNPFTLRKLISTSSPNIQRIIGKAYQGYAGGGSGVLISKGALQTLFNASRSNRSLVEECDSFKQGGKWCFWHSDWVVGRCFSAANVTVLHHQQLTHESCNVGNFHYRISCHHMDPVQMSGAYQALVHLHENRTEILSQTSTGVVLNTF